MAWGLEVAWVRLAVEVEAGCRVAWSSTKLPWEDESSEP